MKRNTGTVAKIGAVLAAPFPDVELLIPALVANPVLGVKFVLGILNKAGKRVSEVQSVLFDKAQWAVADAKKWLKQQGFRIPSADETANFFRFRQKSPARYKEMRTIEAGKHENPMYPEGPGSITRFTPGEGGGRLFRFIVTVGDNVVFQSNDHHEAQLKRDMRQMDGEDAVLWHKGKSGPSYLKSFEYRAENPEPICESLSGHLALTSDPFFQEQPPEIQAAMMTGMDLAESVKRNPFDPDDPMTAFDYGVEGGRLALQKWSASKAKPVNPEVVYAFHHQLHVKESEFPEYLRGFKTVVPHEAIRRGNPAYDLGDLQLRLTKAVAARDKAEARKISRQMTKRLKQIDRGNKLRRNPASDDAAALSEKFHGRPPQQITTVTEEIEERDDFTELGDLVELKVATLSGYDVTLKFAQKGNQIVKLCSSPDGKQLYFIRGDQSVPLNEIHMGGEKWKRDRMILGVLYELTYRTAKGFDKFKVCDYFHKLGEETKEQPMLEYDTLNDSLSVSGGQYRITARGIEN